MPDDPGIESTRELPREVVAVAEHAVRRLRDARRQIVVAELRGSLVTLVQAVEHAARAEELARVIQVATGDFAWIVYVRSLEAETKRLARLLVDRARDVELPE